MNIQILQEHINTFTREVIESGFKRDLDDYIKSLPAAQNNIVVMREIAGKVLSVLDHLYTTDLPDALSALLPKKEIRPFTVVPHNETLRKLVENTEIPQDQFFKVLTNFLSQLIQQIQQNISEIDNIRQFIAPYMSEEMKLIAKENIAVIAIIFKEHHTITSLKEFTKTLSAWNRVLLIYHQLLKSESPEDIQIVEIQNGSIDFIVNLNVDVALDLVELFKVGFTLFAAYLSYKKMAKSFFDSFFGNKKLIEHEEEKEKLFLENIRTAIQEEIEKQHKKAKEVDNGVDDTAVPTKVEQVTALVTSHIVKGNDIKLLAMPESEKAKEEGKTFQGEKDNLRKKSLEARQQFRYITSADHQKLLELYGEIKEDTE